MDIFVINMILRSESKTHSFLEHINLFCVGFLRWTVGYEIAFYEIRIDTNYVLYDLDDNAKIDIIISCNWHIIILLYANIFLYIF
jgi:hypothetical protein